MSLCNRLEIQKHAIKIVNLHDKIYIEVKIYRYIFKLMTHIYIHIYMSNEHSLLRGIKLESKIVLLQSSFIALKYSE